MKILLMLAVSAAELCAQAMLQPSYQRPVVGYVGGPGALEVTPILGIAAAASIGMPITTPAGSLKLYLAPRQQYALLEKESGEAIEVWSLQNQSVRTIAGSWAHADLLSFSPKGQSAVLYSSALGHVQVLIGMPGRASVKAEMALPATAGAVSSLAVSDDGGVVVARNSIGNVYVLAGSAGWRLLPWSSSPSAWTFIANSHDLVASDDEGVRVFRQVDGPVSSGESVGGVVGHPNLLASTSEGASLIAAETAKGKIWIVDLETGAVKVLTGVRGVSSLISVRDGHTFLLSLGADATFALLNVASATADPVILVHAGAGQ